jgi:hypothetical protein
MVLKERLLSKAKELGVSELSIALAIYPKHMANYIDKDSDKRIVRFNALQSLRLVYRGITELKASQIIALSELLNVSTDYILKGE